MRRRGETYELSVTADELVITPTAFAPGYAVTVNGQAAESGTAVTMPVNAEGAEIAVAVSSGGRSRTYTLAVQRVAAVDVTVRHDSDVTVHVFNSARAEIGAAEQGSGFGRFALVPGEAYTYVTDKQTWYHAAGGFTAAGGLTVDAQTPDTIDALDSLYLATKGTKIQSNDQVCLAVPAHAKLRIRFFCGRLQQQPVLLGEGGGLYIYRRGDGEAHYFQGGNGYGAASDQLPENRGRYADADHPGFPRWRGRDLLSGLRHHHI